MAEGSTANATWKAVRTLEWKQKQKKPAAASKGVGAILGEAADVVVGKYAASGPGALGASSAYLNRLSEIQIQDEAYIHQQLVKPDEVKPKRPAHRLLLPRGSKSGRGLRISLSRKVRFNDGDSSPTHKAAAAAGRTAQPGSAGTAAAASATKPDAAAGIAGHGLSRTGSSEGGSVQVAAVGHKAGRRPGVSFAAPAGTISPRNGSSGQMMPDGPSASHVGSGTPQAVDNATAGTSSTAAAASPGAEGCRYNSQETPSGPGKLKPAAADQQQQQQAQHMKPGSINGSSSSSSQRQPVRTQPAGAGGGQHTHAGPPGSTTTSSSSSAHVLGDNAIMTRFLQQQPCGLESPHGSGTDSSSMMGTSQQPDRHAGGPTAAAAPSGRRTTDLVDKQLQWLRGSSAGSTTNNSSSGGGGGGSPAASTQGITRLGSGVPPEDFSITLGYRPMAIPQELFDRWSNVGAAKPATQAGPAATATAAAVASSGRQTGAGAAGASSSNKGTGAVASRRSSNSNSTEAVVPGSRLGASPSPAGSRPGSGPEPHLAAGKTLAGQLSNPSGGGGGGMSWQCDAAAGGPPARRLSAANVLDTLEHHRSPHRQRTADGITLSNLAASLKPPSSSTTSRMAGTGSTGSTAAGLTASSTAASLPASGRASPVLDPGRGGSSNTRHAGTTGAGVSSARIAAAVAAGVARASSVPTGSSSWQLQQSSEKCNSSSHGSNSSGNSDQQTGWLSPFRPASHPGTLGKTGPAAAGAGAGGSSHMGPRRASSRALQEDLVLASGGTGSVAAGQHRTNLTAASAGSSQQHWPGQLQPPQQHQVAGGPQHDSSSCVGPGGRVHLPDIGTKATTGPQQRAPTRSQRF